MGFPLSDAEHAAIKAQIADLPELIVAAAIRNGDQIVMVERPGRHGNCINWMNRLGLNYRDQGFVTSRGRFVGRDEAARLAVAAGQATPRDNCNGHLFSEDVWNDWDESPRTPICPEDIFGTPQNLAREGEGEAVVRATTNLAVGEPEQ